MEKLSQRLVELRKSSGLTQQKVAYMLNLPQGSINRYEHNQSNPTPDTLLWYADYFDVSLDYIFGRTDDPHGATYENAPKYSPEVLEFIERCFDPKTDAHRQLKKLLLDMMTEGGEKHD